MNKGGPMAFPISIGVCAGIGMVLTLAIYGPQAMVWGLIGGAALGSILGLVNLSGSREQ
jgi:hypothetical protein